MSGIWQLVWGWLLAGALSQSVTAVTAYGALGEEGLSHSCAQTKAGTVFVDPVLPPGVTRALEQAVDVKAIVYNQNAAQTVEPKHVEAIKENHSGVSLHSYEEFLVTTTEDLDPIPPPADDLAALQEA